MEVFTWRIRGLFPCQIKSSIRFAGWRSARRRPIPGKNTKGEKSTSAVRIARRSFRRSPPNTCPAAHGLCLNQREAPVWNTPAPCIPRCAKLALAPARSVAWRLSRVRFRLKPRGESELIDMRRRFWVSLALTIPVLALAMGEYIPGWPVGRWIGKQVQNWLELLIATPVVLWGGWPFFVRGVLSVKNRALNMFTLIGLGVTVAYVYSLVATIFPGIFPTSFHGASGQVDVYFEAAAVIVTLVLLGQVLELRAPARPARPLRRCLDLRPRLPV